MAEPSESTLANYQECKTATEWIFGMDNGALAHDANSAELQQIYSGYVKRLVNSYEKLKTKFNTYAAKCLSERQKRECGLALVAPPLVLPHELAGQGGDVPAQQNSSAQSLVQQTHGFDDDDAEEVKNEQVRLGSRMGPKPQSSSKPVGAQPDRQM